MSDEILIDNYLTDDVVRVFYPMNFVLSVLLSAKYSIRNNYITPTSLSYNITVNCITIFIILLKSYDIISEHRWNAIGQESVLFIPVLFIIHLVYYCVTTIILCILNITKTQTNISLVLRIQKIHNSICKNRSIDRTSVWNWLLFFAIFSQFFLLMFSYFMTSYCNSIHILGELVYFNFDIHYIYSIRVIVLLKIYLYEWMLCVRKLGYELENDKHCKKMFEDYRNILKSFKLFKDAFQLLTFIWTVYIFISALSYIQIALEANKFQSSAKFKTGATATIVMWILRALFLQVILCLACERFYIAVEDTNLLCLERMKEAKCPVDQKRFCKRIIQYNHASYCKMSACGLFDVDATLPLTLIGALTNYIIVLLQFALL